LERVGGWHTWIAVGLLLAAVFCQILLPVPVHADEFRLLPFITLRGEYNDNIFFSATDEQDDWISTISPGLRLVDRTERLDSELYGRLDLLYYADNSDLDSTDGEAFGRLRYQASPRLGLYTRAGYAKTSRPDRDLVETGLVQSAEPRDRYQFDAQGTYQLTEIVASSLQYDFDKIEYRDEEFIDSTIHRVQWGFIWDADRWVPNTDTRFFLGYANGDYETSKVDSYSATVGAEWDYSEIWSVSADAGVRYTETESDVLKLGPGGFFIDQETSERLSGIGVLSLIYDGAYTNWDISFLNDVRNAPGSGGTALRTELTGSLRHRFTEKISGTLRAGYYINDTDEDLVAVDPVDEQTFRVRPGLSIEITRDLFLDFAYKYARVKDDIDDVTRVQNTVFAELYWQYPLIE
jgi:hypothetical protein